MNFPRVSARDLILGLRLLLGSGSFGSGRRLRHGRLGRGSSASLDFNVRDLYRTKWAFTIGCHARDLFDQLDRGRIALAEDGISAVEAGIWNLGDKKLRAIGIPASICVGKASRTVERQAGRGLILEFVTGVPHTIAGGISALNHELRDDAMKDGAIVERHAVLLRVRDRVGPILGPIREPDKIGNADRSFFLIKRAA